MGTTAVDLAALAMAAARVDTAAESVMAAVAERLGDLQFGAPTAGRAHGAAGAALHAEVERLAVDLIRWGHAGRGVAAALRSGAEGHTAAEAAAVAALR